MVNPHNLKPEIMLRDGHQIFGPEVADRYPYMMKVLFICWSCLVVIGVALVNRRDSATKEPSIQKTSRYIVKKSDL